MEEYMEKEMRSFLEGFKLLRQMKEAVDQTCCHGGCCEDEDDEDDECEIMDSLDRDYRDLMKWIFGEDGQLQFSKRKAKRIWRRLHPGLEVPRVLQSEKSVNPALSTLCLFLDAYPMYLAEKRKYCG